MMGPVHSRLGITGTRNVAPRGRRQEARACLQAGADCLVTRNAKDYKGAPVALRSPGEALALVAAS